MKHALEVKQVGAAFRRFADLAAPYSNIRDDAHYRRALTLLDELLEDAEDSPNDPLNPLIDMLAGAIERYEGVHHADSEFDRHLEHGSGVDVLRVLMDQHGLGMSDLPEIGSKSMVSRVLSGQRDLSKKHILALAERFSVDPSLFL